MLHKSRGAMLWTGRQDSGSFFKKDAIHSPALGNTQGPPLSHRPLALPQMPTVLPADLGCLPGEDPRSPPMG